MRIILEGDNDGQESSSLCVAGNRQYPVVQLNKVVPLHSADVFVKLEYYNPTGSYKDRMALAMIEEAEQRGDLLPGMTVVEYTGGSTGSSLAFVCAVKGYRFHVVSSDAFAQEKLQTMKAFGARLDIIPSRDGKVTPDLVPRMMQHAREIAESEPSYFTNQLHNADAAKGYERIGQELLEQIDGPNLLWAFPDREAPANVPPWDNLRANLFPAHVYLNKLRPEEYRRTAASHLNILLFEPRDINHDYAGTEGERFLTPDIENELSRYPRELLLTRSYCIICRKENRKAIH